jgi:hypothetical protein
MLSQGFPGCPSPKRAFSDQLGLLIFFERKHRKLPSRSIGNVCIRTNARQKITPEKKRFAPLGRYSAPVSVSWAAAVECGHYSLSITAEPGESGAGEGCNRIDANWHAARAARPQVSATEAPNSIETWPGRAAGFFRGPDPER